MGCASNAAFAEDSCDTFTAVGTASDAGAALAVVTGDEIPLVLLWLLVLVILLILVVSLVL